MEYELYNNYEDKLNVLRTQNRLIDELQLSSRIPKLHIRDAATEEKEKVGVLTDMWNSYSSPLFSPQSGRDLLGTHLMWKTSLMRRLKAEAVASGVNNFDAEFILGPRYSKDKEAVNSSGIKTYMMDPHTIKSLYLTEFTSPIELKQYSSTLISKGLVSGNLNIFLTVQKTLYFGLENGLTKRDVANFLLQILEKESPSYVSLVKGSALSPEQIFENVIDCVKSNTDVMAIKRRIENVTRNLGSPLKMVLNGLSKLVEEFISLQYPFESPEKKNKRLEKYLMSAVNDFVEAPTRQQIQLLKEARYQQDKVVNLSKIVDFATQLERAEEYALKTPKTASSKSYGLTVNYNSHAGGGLDLLPISVKESPDLFPSSTKTKAKKKKNKKPVKPKSRSPSPVKVTSGPKNTKPKSKAKQTNNNQLHGPAPPVSGANKSTVNCPYCATVCSNKSGRAGNCDHFSKKDVEKVKEKCPLCQAGFHKPGGKCGILYNTRMVQKNSQKAR